MGEDQGVDPDVVFDLFANVTDNFVVDQSVDLSILRVLLKRLGGDIRYELRNNGTDFFLSFPMKKGPKHGMDEVYVCTLEKPTGPSATIEAMRQYSQLNKDKRQAKILLVEDDLIAQHAMKSLITSLRPAEVDCVGSCSAFKEKVNNGETDYDLVILDLNLPDGSGAQLYSEYAKDFNMTPAVILTANSIEKSSHLEDLIFENPAIHNFYNKPLKMQRLISILDLIKE